MHSQARNKLLGEKMACRAATMVALLLAAVAATCARAQLHEKFYGESCPSVEDVVRKEMVRALSLAPSLAGPLLRMHFHDCFVRVSYICMHVVCPARTLLCAVA